MGTKSIDVVYVVVGVIMGMVTVFALVSCTFPGNPETTQIIGPEGKPVYNPPGPVERIVQLPSTGDARVDYIAASVAAAVYGALGYWIRRVKKNGTAATTELSDRLSTVEKKTASLPIPSPPTTTQISMADLVDLLHAVKQQGREAPPSDGTAQ